MKLSEILNPTPKELRGCAVRFYRKAEKEQDKEKRNELLESAKMCFIDAGETDLSIQCEKLQTGELSF